MVLESVDENEPSVLSMFLVDRDPRTLSGAYPADVRAGDLFLGHGAGPLEVVTFSASGLPTAGLLRDLHRIRQGGRATPVVVVVLWGGDRAAIATRFGTQPVEHADLERAQVERLCRSVLDAPDRHAGDELLRQKLRSLAEQPIAGLRNAGLFALHELEHGIPHRPDWPGQRQRGSPLLHLRGRELVERLGFTIEALPGPASVLRAQGTRIAVAVFLQRADEIERASEQYDLLSPVSYALAKADSERLDYVVVLAASVLRVYPVQPGVGTARRGRTETFIELDLALLPQESAGYLPLIASADALAAGGTFSAILEASKRFAADLGARLRDRIYEDVMPQLCAALVKAQRLRNPSRERLADTFEMSLLVLFRLLFVAYAEDKELLPWHTSPRYREHSLKTLAQRLAAEHEDDTAYGGTHAYWDSVRILWEAVDKGNPSWRVPAYNGGLFAEGADAAPSAQRLSALHLPDDAFAPALRALLVDDSADGIAGPVDFRALGVREFGTIYEGLLEQELSIAEHDLTLDNNGAYVPASAMRGRGRRRAGAVDSVMVAAGEVYLHDKSGARKATGAYYTKDFAVEHLLERSLGPALDEHLRRLDAQYDVDDAARAFFDFHVADIAMGSGHFLVAAVDWLERGLSGYLARRSLPGVRDELARLRASALKALGDDWRGEPIEDTQLLRRQIARRCIHGVDLNPLSVELARLSLWIHTFVPGLPLSFLDGSLRCGNSLVGIATFEEARELLAGEYDDLFAFTADSLIASAREPLKRLSLLAEATAAEVKNARQYYAKARAAIAPTEQLFTVLAASRLDPQIQAALDTHQLSGRVAAEDLFTDALLRKAERVLKGLGPLHFPTAFPQVFDRPRAGFDVILGNPPWQEATVEELAFWARHDPGLRGLARNEQGRRVATLRRTRADLIPVLEAEREEAERLRSVLTSGQYPGMGTGDPDLYKAFCWRFWSLVAADGGRIGVVLPRSAFAAKGSTEFRQALFEKAQLLDLTMLLNSGGWVFDEAEYRYTIALACIARGVTLPDAGAVILLDGPYPSRSRYEQGLQRVAERPIFHGRDIAKWNDASSLPLLPTPGDAEVFLQLRKAPRLDYNSIQSWRARPFAELHATNDADLMVLDADRRPRGHWPVFKGESFDLWTPDRGPESYYGWADPAVVQEALYERRLRAGNRPDSPFGEFEARWREANRTLPCLQPRIAFRDITNRTNQRTVIAALVPPKVVLTNKAPFLLWPRGDIADQAFLLGVLSSIALDWYARRFVEVSLNYFIFNPFPIPRPTRDNVLWQRAVALSGRLGVQEDDRFAEWGAAIGVAPAPLEADERDALIAELDAVVGRLYGLSERGLCHVFETFHEGWDYAARLDLVLSHFRRLPSA